VQREIPGRSVPTSPYAVLTCIIGGFVGLWLMVPPLLGADDAERRTAIVDNRNEAFEPLMHADPVAFRAKLRNMAADPFAFYRG